MACARRHNGVAALTATLALSGCLGSVSPEAATRFGQSPLAESPAAASTPADLSTDAQTPEPQSTEYRSPLISDLVARRSVLVPGSSYAEVAASVMAADARVAEAELRAAELRRKAADKNWLPTIGPRITLTGLGDVVSDLVLNQVLFDHGRKEAERERARGEVELAAVDLVEDGNDRVHDALTLYLDREEGREASAHFDRALGDMSRFEHVMLRRVEGGVSDPSDLNILRQKLADIRANRDRAKERALSAEAELAAMSARPLSDLHGIGSVAPSSPVDPLAVRRAEAERDIAVAQVRIDRAAHLPGLSASAAFDGRETQSALGVEAETGFGFGTPASLEALEARKEAAVKRVAEAREDANRRLASLERDRSALKRQGEEAEGLTRAAKANLDQFQKQYDYGQRRVMDVVGVYETYASALESAIDLKYRLARTDIAIAHMRGQLVDGGAL
ncbi:TolC family protein [Litorisediminicola beolgyonensis]|uniref:TolC family protein n=1 Tax=Litorisediminicola beolgyonensis TaxID=1173614 RepID=A0ABW3ZEL9_9RHOB